MAKADCIEMPGIVVDLIKGGKFKVKLENGYITTCTLSGKMRENYIKVLKDDKVTVELSPYSLDLGRIIYRDKE